MKKNSKISRRRFIGTTSTAAAGFMIVPSNTIAGLGHKAPSDKLNIAGIGIGGMGRGNLQRMSAENIVALCDVQWGKDARNNVPQVLRLTPKRQSIMIGERCLMRWVNLLMQFWLQLLTIIMPALQLMPSQWVNMHTPKNR